MKIGYTIFIILLIVCIRFSTAQTLDGKVFKIKNYGNHSKNKVLCVDQKSLGRNGGSIKMCEDDTKAFLLWKFVAANKGLNTYYIINLSAKAGKHKYLEVAESTLGQDGGKIQLWAFNQKTTSSYSNNQIWIVDKNKDNSYSLISAHVKSHGKVLEADRFTFNGYKGNVQLYFRTASPYQKWTFIESL